MVHEKGPPGTPTTTSRSDGRDEELERRAKLALEQSYSPYSGVRVGAALRSADGRVFAGCNVENASYGLTCCAERTALVKAVSEGAREFRAIAIATNRDRALMPCGACRQILAEFAPRLPIVALGADGTRRETSLDALLPDAFGPADLR